MKNNKNTNKRGRPKGQFYDNKIDFRLPDEMLRSLKDISSEAKVPVAKLLREGVHYRLTASVKDWIDKVEKPETNGLKKLDAIKKIRRARIAVLACEGSLKKNNLKKQ